MPKVTGTSTYSVVNKKTGDWEARQQWVKTATGASPEALVRIIRDTLRTNPPRYDPATFSVPKYAPSDICTVYPVGDHHLGMLSWPEETGADYNVKIGTQLLEKAVAYLLTKATKSSDCLVIFLGDFMHFDSLQAVTPTNMHVLDADSRYPLMARAAIHLMQAVIAACAQHHGRVRVIVEQGNHDPTSAIMLSEALAAYYRTAKGVTVDNAPGVFHYYKWGRNLIGTHHGHSVRDLAKLPLIMAEDRKKEWAATEHRLFLTGHLHKDRVLDGVGCRVESVRILPPTDAWATEMGYRSVRQMQSIQLHKRFGETARFLVKPDMVGQ